ncbi:hypothetical protein BKG70_17225 [Mycobacteroides chelonae]|nr:hypothetical protein BKG70_17225 [Mycobacteroides chelonae]
MQLLSSALPGFRDLRSPLIAGYLWLLFLWILVKPDVKTRPSYEVAAALYDLGREAGPIWIGLAVGVCAFLGGSVSLAFSPMLNSLLDRIKTFWWGVEHSKTMSGRNLPRIFRKSGERRHAEYARDPLYEYYPEAAEKLSMKPNYNKYTGEMIDPDDEVGQKSLEAGKALAREIALPTSLLLSKEPELFSEADRLKAESQLRFAVIPPLAAIVAYLAVTITPAWCLALLPVVVLWTQGHNRNYDYDYDYESLMYGAIQLGKFSPQL